METPETIDLDDELLPEYDLTKLPLRRLGPGYTKNKEVIMTKKNYSPIEVEFEPEDIDNMKLYECAFCNKKEAFKIKVDKIMGRGKGRFVIDDIPAYHCNNCQQQYIDGSTMTMIDEVRRNPAAYVQKKQIGVFKMAA